MFSETDGSRKAIGDVDILFHDGLYHLFHLVLPNHDFIAHAVSTNGVNWRRVRNALFIGDPGSWDDLMLWTAHVSPDPHQPGRWRMFYTGLTRRDRGDIQRIGLAVSDDLYSWRKEPVHWEDGRGPDDPEPIQRARRQSERTEANEITALVDPSSCFPLAADPEHYESSLDEGRQWISFRDPFFVNGEGCGWLLAAARIKDGPIVRRGCVALMEEVDAHHFEARPALCRPELYDDVEVPNLIRIDDHYYLIGSMREDAKIRYWHSTEMLSGWRSYHDNVLMPQGNYAGRVCRDEGGWLLWCFFAMNRQDRTVDNLMPPPKRLKQAPSGLLYLETFERLLDYQGEEIDTRCVRALKPHEFGDHCRADPDRWAISSEYGFQGFVFEEELENFRLSCRLKMQGLGKCGLLFRIDPESHDGYYLSLDLFKGVAQLRAWGTETEEIGEHMMDFNTLQSAFWATDTPGEAEISLLTFGSYLELSLGGKIALSLADRRFTKGYVGVYLDTAELVVSELQLRRMNRPEQYENHLVGA